MGAEVVKLEDADVAGALVRFAAEQGRDAADRRADAADRWWHRLRRGSVVDQLVNKSAVSTC